MALGSTQPLVKMSTRNILGGKGGRCIRLTTYHHTVPLSRNLGALTLLDPSGPARPITGVLYVLLENVRYDSTFRFILIKSDHSFIELTSFTNLIDTSNCHIAGTSITTETSRVNTFKQARFLYGEGNLQYVSLLT